MPVLNDLIAMIQAAIERDKVVNPDAVEEVVLQRIRGLSWEEACVRTIADEQEAYDMAVIMSVRALCEYDAVDI